MFNTQCEGISCSAIKNYSWSLFVRLENGFHKSWGEINNLYTIALTSLNGPNLIFNGGDSSLNRSLLMGNKTYKIHITAWIDGNNFRTDEHIFRTNSPPLRRDSNSGCFMEPRIGNAIETEFKISCVNWSDPDTPLSYQFSYQTNFGIVVFYTGWQPNVTTELPEGSKASNYSLYLKLQVIDSLGDSSLELIIAQVFITQITVNTRRTRVTLDPRYNGRAKNVSAYCDSPYLTQTCTYPWAAVGIDGCL